jgi:hypothetical protein
MSLNKGSDVQRQLRLSLLAKMDLGPPESQPDTSGLSVTAPCTIEANPKDFAEDFVSEHSSPCGAVAPAKPVTGLSRQSAPTVSKDGHT